MIVRDEERTLARCLSCVTGFADEIIIVDTGSVDSTVKIAREYTDKVYFFKWCDDFAAARNFSFSKAGCELLMWLDADDVITPDNADKISALKESEFGTAYIKYAVASDNGKPTYVYYRERIFRRELNPRWEGEVHEAVCPVGAVLYSDACIFHDKLKPSDRGRNLRIYLNLLSQGKKLDSRGKFYYGRELYFNGLYTECAAVLADYLDGDGWVVNKVEACRTLHKCYLAMGREAEAVNALLRAFTFARPQAEDCCALGAYFEGVRDVRCAIYWYECALSLPQEIEDGGFFNLDYSYTCRQSDCACCMTGWGITPSPRTTTSLPVRSSPTIKATFIISGISKQN